MLKNGCDFVLLETGVGGTLDSTNIVKPIFSIITSVGFDHMKTLGNTLTEIAQNKAGIIKLNTDAIFLELKDKKENAQVLKVIQEKCKQEKSKLHLIKRNQIVNYQYNENYQYFDYQSYQQLIINLKGKIQTYNATICIKAIQLLKEKGYIISEKAIREGLKTVKNPGRFEVINNSPIVIFDGAHNMPAIENFMANMKQYYSNKEKVYILSVLKKKDYDEIIKYLAQDQKAIIYVTNGNNKLLYASKEELYQVALSYVKKENIEKMNLQTAIKTAIKKYPDRAIGIVGSFYIYGDVIKIGCK